MFDTLRRKGIVGIPGSHIPLYWWQDDDHNNFGDQLGPYMVEKLSGKPVFRVAPGCLRKHHLTVGSILKYSGSKSVVWGSGILNRFQKFKLPMRVHAVRGPLTRDRILQLGGSCPEIYGDPALLLPRIYDRPVARRYALGVVPHFIDYARVTRMLGDEEGVALIDLSQPVERVVDSIRACEYIVSSSLHGLIVAHAYGIPAMWVRFSDKLAGDGVKFSDYFLSVNFPDFSPLELEGIDVPRLREKIDALHPGDIDIDLDALLGVCPFAMTSN